MSEPMRRTVFKGDVYSKRRTNTDSQVRKHSKQMSLEEISRCCVLISGIQKLRRSGHLRKKNISFSMGAIYSVLRNPNLHKNIIEYNEKYDSRNERWVQRVLINIPNLVDFKTKDGIKEGYLKAVIDVTTKEVVTVYFNEKGDNHSNLDLSYYHKSLKIRPSKKGGYQNINPGVKM